MNHSQDDNSSMIPVRRVSSKVPKKAAPQKAAVVRRGSVARRPSRLMRTFSDNGDAIEIPVTVTKKTVPSNQLRPKKVATTVVRPVAAEVLPVPELEDDLLASVVSEIRDDRQKSTQPRWVGRMQKKHAKQVIKHRNHSKKQAVGAHLDELRRRLLFCVSALVFGGAVGYQYQTEIITWLVRPLGQQLFYTSPTGGFDFLIKICLFFGFLLAVPVIIYNVIQFLAPAVPRRIRYSVSRLLVLSIMLALAGVSFAYYISLPAALHFLNNFTNEQISSLISAQEYFNFVMIYLAGFAVLFQMPLLFSFINKITPLKPALLMQKQRMVILVSFIIAAILTPTPDPMNQTIMAVPIIGLYQVSVGVVWQSNKRQRRKKGHIAPVIISATEPTVA